MFKSLIVVFAIFAAAYAGVVNERPERAIAYSAYPYTAAYAPAVSTYSSYPGLTTYSAWPGTVGTGYYNGVYNGVYGGVPAARALWY